MIKPKPSQYLLPPPDFDLAAWAAGPVAGYRLRVRKVAGGRRSRYYDTFDWRLFRKGLVLVREGRACCLRDYHNDRELAAQALGGRERPLMLADLPTGTVRERLAKIVEMRALLPLLTLEIGDNPWDILNPDGKIVLRGRLLTLSPRPPAKSYLPLLPESVGPAPGRSQSGPRVVGSGDLPAGDPGQPPSSGNVSASAPPSLRLLVLEPVTGYPKPLQQVRDWLLARGCKDFSGINDRLYHLAGYRPGSYSQKLDIALAGDWPAARVAREILSHQCRVMRLNEAGIIADLDSEFLHDFRVALRRSRAALARIKGVFPPEEVSRFRAELGSLAKAGNRLRDLDVYLLQKKQYLEMLPPCLQPGLEPLFAELAVERRREFRKFRRLLRGEKYQRTMSRWENFLASPPHDRLPAEAGAAAPNAALPVARLARRAIARACARLLRHGLAIGPDSPDQDLHALRLDCKKLRYLFEFFAELFPRETIAPLIARTKRLQDNLGDFNDLFIQQEALRGFLRELEQAGKRCSDRRLQTAAAIGGLVSILNRRQQRVRKDFAKTFRAFVDCEHRRRLCPGPGSNSSDA